jgi:hypothetical protein
VLREVRYRIGTPGFRTRELTLVTTRLDAEAYGVSDLAELYRQRWPVETSLAQLKTTMPMDVLHCKPVPGVLKELTMFAIVDHLVRLVMWPSATLQHTAVERISFLEALRWLGAPSTGVPLGALIVHPVRPHRVEPRVKKRRPKSFPLMMKPRQALRQQRLQQALGGNLMPFGSSSLLVIQVHGSTIATSEERVADWKILVNQWRHEHSLRDEPSHHLGFTKNDEEPGCCGELWRKCSRVPGFTSWSHVSMLGVLHQSRHALSP